VGTFLSPMISPVKAKVLPLSMPPEVPLYYSDFEDDCALELLAPSPHPYPRVGESGL